MSGIEALRYAVCALLYHPTGNGQIVAVSRRGKPMDLGLPGGKVEPGETEIEAVVRECREEIGVEIFSHHVNLIYARPSDLSGRRVACFHVVEWRGRPRCMEEGIEVRWVRPEEITRRPDCTYGEYNKALFQWLRDVGHDDTMLEWRQGQIADAQRYRACAEKLRGEADAYEQKAHDVLLRLVDRSPKR